MRKEGAEPGSDRGAGLPGARPRSLFLTGADGFIGRALLARLRAAGGFDIRRLTRRPGADGEAGGAVVHGDLERSETYAAALDGVDTIVHLAAVTGKAPPARYRQINVDAVGTLIEAGERAGVRNILFMSSIAAKYPNKRYYPYARSKADAERLVAQSKLRAAVVRPTLVLGPQSPIWLTLEKIAGLPVIPMPAGGKAMVQPIDADEVTKAVMRILNEGRFRDEVFEIGGPDALPIADLVRTIARERERTAHMLPVPLWPLRFGLALLEPLARPVLPATAGQLAVFANDSTVSANWLQDAIAHGLPATEALVKALVRTPISPLVRPKPRPAAMAADYPAGESRARLEAECRIFSRYLADALPPAGACEAYLRGLAVHDLADEAGLTRFQRAALQLARSGPLGTRLADAYAGLFQRRGPLRRKLIAMLAILEHTEPTSAVVDAPARGGRLAALMGLFGRGVLFGACFVAGTMAVFGLALIGRARPSPALRRQGQEP